MFDKRDYFYHVYKEHSFSKAAEKLYISQPSLSAIITREEKKIGSPVFDRSTNPVSLTPIGEKYISCCEQIFRIEDDFHNFIHSTEELVTGNLCIGSSHVFISTILPEIISEFGKAYPSVRLEVVDLDSDDLKKELLSGTLDLIIDNNRLEKNISEIYPLGSECLLIALPKQHQINEQLKKERLTFDDIENNVHLSNTIPAIDLSKLKDVPFVTMQKGYDTRARMDQILKDASVTPHIIFEMNQLAGIFSIISSGIGASVISDTLIKKSPFTSVQLYYYKINHPSALRPVFIQKKKNRYLTPPMNEFIRIAKSCHTLTL